MTDTTSSTQNGGRLRIGLVQMCASRTVEDNVDAATRGIREAASRGATYIQTPEFTTLMEMQSKRLFAETTPEENNPVIAHFGGPDQRPQIRGRLREPLNLGEVQR